MDVWQLFIRHADRHFEDQGSDDGLSEQGKDQCLELVNYLDRLKPPRIPETVLSSPKRRCVETAQYIAAWAGVKVEIEPELDEQGAKEGDQDFLNRIRVWCENTQMLSRHCFVSHGDVLPLIGRLRGSFVAKIKKGDLFFVENDVVVRVNELHSHAGLLVKKMR